MPRRACANGAKTSPSWCGIFIDRISRNNGLPPPDISASALHALCRHAWPGNVRELENIIERTLVLHDRECARIEVADIRLPESRAAADTLAELAVPMDDHLNRIETGLIRQALAKTDGNITDAARLLGTTFRSLRYKMKKLGVAGLGWGDVGALALQVCAPAGRYRHAGFYAASRAAVTVSHSACRSVSSAP